MNARLLGLFSGFPTHHFTETIAEVLRENLPRRESLVFLSAWPDDYSRNDADSDGMHEMFAERGMGFVRHCVIDRRTGAQDAARLLSKADCVFLMGGDPPAQMALIRDLGLAPTLLSLRAVILGVSAGSMNMGRFAVDCWETKELYEGIGLVDIVTKGHYEEDAWFIPVIKEISMTRPVAAMEDESAIFIRENAVWQLGNIHWVDKGGIAMLTDEMLKLAVPTDRPPEATLPSGQSDDLASCEPRMDKATRKKLAKTAEETAKLPFHGDVDGTASNLAPIVKPFPTWSVKEADGLWCAAFVYYCCKEAGFDIPYRPKECLSCHLAGCLGWEEFAISDPRIEYHKGSEDFVPEAGDIVIYDRVFENNAHDHIGIVLEKRGRTILAAEGNVNNISGIVERPLDDHIRAYIRIPDGYKYEA